MSTPRLYDRHSMELLKDIAEALNEANHIDAAMEAILPRLGEVLGLTTAWAFRFDERRSAFVEVGSSGLPPALSCENRAVLRTGWCECQDQFVEGRLKTAVNLVTCSRLRDAPGDKSGLVCHASIPLRSKGKPLGILNMAAKGGGDFTEDALALLGAIGHQVAIALDRAQMLQEERHRAYQLEALTNLSRELVSYVNESQLLQRAVDGFVEQLHYESCGITLAPLAAVESDASLLVAAAHRSVKASETVYSYDSDEGAEPLDEADRWLLPDARSFIEVEIPHTEYRLRVESSRQNAFLELDYDVVSSFSLHLSAALENAKLYQQSVETAKWRERRRLAADLHDSVSQRLFSALLLTRTTNLLMDAPAGNRSDIRETLAKIEGLIKQSQEEMKSMIQTLHPVAERGFSARIRERIDPLQLQSNTRIHLSLVSHADACLSAEQSDAMLKVIDEAIQNVLKHANAKHAYVTLAMSEGSLFVTVKDDGCGFDEVNGATGLGMTTMRDRLAAIGGSLRIMSTTGEGTTVICELPLGGCHCE